MDRFIVMTASARMPSSYRGIYRRVAVVETNGVTEPKMISERARGCVRIVETWERCRVGKTERSAYARALKAAREMAAELNQGDRMIRTQLTYKKNGHIDWVAMDAAGIRPATIYAEAVYHGDTALAVKASRAGERIELRRLRELRKAGGAA